MHFDAVTEKFGNLNYMRLMQAEVLRDFFLKHECRDILELGFYQGKSSAYMAAVLEDRGGPGHVTTMDLVSAKNHSPNIHDVLEQLGLSHRVTPVYCERSYVWEMGKLIRDNPGPQYDFIYIDAGHVWDVTGFGFCLAHVLLRPGGWVLFDDLNWTIARSPAFKANPAKRARYPLEEQNAQQVQMVFDLLVPAYGYINLQTSAMPGDNTGGRWGFAQKPMAQA